MALDRLTKVDGGGINTTSDYRVGIITASKFVGPFDGTGGNFSGVVTATNGVFSGNISAVDGNFSGNVTIGGTLTYEDVTNIDSVGIITAQSNIHVGGGVSAVGVGTFGSLDIGGDIDVDGHTNLDNVSIAGVTTFASNIVGTNATFSGNINASGSGSISGFDAITIEAATPALNFTETDADPDYRIIVLGGQFRIQDVTNGLANRFIINTDGTTTIEKNLNCSSDLDVDGHTNLDNVSIAGVTTFSNNVKFDGATAGRDVTFIRSSNTLEFATNAILELGNGGSGDCRLFNNGTDTRIVNGDGTLKFESDTHEFRDKDNTTSYLTITSAGNMGLGTNNPSQLLSLSSTSPRILLTHATSPASNCFIDYAASGVLELSIDDNNVSANSKLQVRMDGAAAKLTIDANGVVQVTKGTSGGATANTDAALILDNNSHTYVQFRTPSNKEQGLLFGDTADNDVGSIIYNHSSNHLGFTVNTNERARIDQNGKLVLGNEYVNYANADPAISLFLSGTRSGSYGGAHTNAIIFDNQTAAVDAGGTITLAGYSGTQAVAKAVIRGGNEGSASTNNGYFAVFTRPASANLTERFRIDSSGHGGLGVEPNANWPTNNDFKALQIGTGACVFGRGSGDEDRGGIAVNWYSDGSNNKYIGNGNAARIYLADGNIYFSNAAANSSGANASMTLQDRMILDSSGRLIVGGGTHAGGSALVVKGGGVNTYSTVGLFGATATPSNNAIFAQIRFGSGTTQVGATINAKADADWGSLNDYPTRLEFYTAPDGSGTVAERLRITSGGDVKIISRGSTTSGAPLYVAVTGKSSINYAGGNDDTACVRIEDEGGTNSYYHGLELRSKNGGDVRLYCHDQGTGDRSDFVVATDSGGLNERLRVKFNGQIIHSATAGDNQYISKRTGSAGSNGDYFYQLFARNSGDTTVGGIGIHRDTATDDGRIVFTTRNSGGSNTERLRIQSDGRIRFMEDPVQRNGGAVDNFSGDGAYMQHYVSRDGSTYRRVLDIAAVGDTTWGCAIRFSTNRDGNSTSQERLQILKDGGVYLRTMSGFTNESGNLSSGVGYDNRTRLYPYWVSETGACRFHFSATANPGIGQPRFWLFTNGTNHLTGKIEIGMNQRTNYPNNARFRNHQSTWQVAMYGEGDNDGSSMRYNYQEGTQRGSTTTTTYGDYYVSSNGSSFYGTNDNQYQDGYGGWYWKMNNGSDVQGHRFHFDCYFSGGGFSTWYMYIDQ